MRFAVLTLFAFAGLAPAADPPPDLALKVRVALALNGCQCDTPGLHCADPDADIRDRVSLALTGARKLADKPAAKPAPAPRPIPMPAKPAGDPYRLESYTEVLARVEAGLTVRMFVRVPDTDVGSYRPHYHTDGFPATAAGVYDCSKEPGGTPVMRPVAAPSANPLPVPAPATDWRPAILPGFGGFGFPAGANCFGGT